MPGKKPATPTFSPDVFGQADLAKLDAHAITAEEYDELPGLTDETTARADHHAGGRLARRGRPPKAAPKKAVSIRLSPVVLAHFRAGGPGWQTRIDELLQEVARREGAAIET